MGDCKFTIFISSIGVFEILTGVYFSFEEFLHNLVSEKSEALFVIASDPQNILKIDFSAKNFFSKEETKLRLLENVFSSIKSIASSLVFSEKSFEEMLAILLRLAPELLMNLLVFAKFTRKGFNVKNANLFGVEFMATAAGSVHSQFLIKVVGNGNCFGNSDLLMLSRVAKNSKKVG